MLIKSITSTVQCVTINGETNDFNSKVTWNIYRYEDGSIQHAVSVSHGDQAGCGLYAGDDDYLACAAYCASCSGCVDFAGHYGRHVL